MKTAALFEELKNKLPTDHCHQVDGNYYLKKLNKAVSAKILDLGCGSGESKILVAKMFNNAQWFGVDLNSSPEVDNRENLMPNIVSFNGIDLPFKANSFDIVFSKQVFEHVVYPDLLLKEVTRIMKSGSYFTGSVSYLEPYHSHSISNFTPYGFINKIESNGLDVLEIRPGIDGITLIIRSMLREKNWLNYFLVHESPMNYLIEVALKILKKNTAFINFSKLAYCGHFAFLARKKEVIKNVLF